MSEEHDNQPQEQKKSQKKDGPPGAPAWMVTYSDLVTLLLTFFVLLMSMASMDPVRFTEASSSLKDAFGVHSRPAHVEFAIPILPSPPKTKFNPVQTELTTKIHRQLKAQIEEFEMSKDVEAVERDDGTIILRVNNTILFAPGDSRISPQSLPTLRKIADMIRPLPMTLRIEGHTDDQIVSSAPDKDNWSLSIARAVSVTHFYEKSSLLPLDRMSAIGYGSKRPLVPNTNEENRATNRRVDFVLRVKDTSGMSPASSEAGKIPL
ncbi:MAG: flagellar motor protein MotB [Desulfocapsaceae bacterium]|jgi:chemotaxis protein MotB|nr:flagellar motor protein MotB [Desulfocapsaceae bacterium]